VPGSSGSTAPKMRTSADSSKPEKLASKAVAQPHLPMALLAEAQRLELLACLAPSNLKRSLGGIAPSNLKRSLSCLAPSNLKRSLGGPCWAPLAGVLVKCEHLTIAHRQKKLAWKAVAQPHLPMALLAQRHRDCGCLLVLPPQTSNVA